MLRSCCIFGTLGVLLLCISVAPLLGQDQKPAAQDEKSKAPSNPMPAAQPAGQASKAETNPGLEKMKSLAGDWYSADDTAASPGDKPAADKHEPKSSDTPVCVYRVVSAGSAVQETLFPGTPHEMITMYHRDGPDLVMTHYCSLGNQPHMKAEPQADPNKLVFRFVGGANINPAKDDHMHDLTITFLGPDRIRADWIFYSNGQKAGSKTFDLKRASK